jgi:hypothetical protein
MSKMRWVALALFLVVGSTGVDGWSDARAGGPASPCKLATKGDSIVAKACQEGGFEAAKSLMKKMRTKVNKGGGQKVECGSCHEGVDDGRYDLLTKDGRDRFKSFVADYLK